MPPVERVFLASPVAAAGGRVIASPFQFLFTGEDNLRIHLFNSLAGVSVTLQGRFFDTAGRVQAFAFTVTPSSDRTANTYDRPLGEGYLLNLSVVASAGAPLVGQTYCMVQIIRGLSGATILLGCLLGGYITAMQHLGYPGSPIVSSTEGEPYVRAISGTAPALGVEVSETVPTGARWELLSLHARLTTDATVINRRPHLTSVSSGLRLINCVQALTTPSSSVVDYFWEQGMPLTVSLSTTVGEAGVPASFRAVAGATIDTLTDSFQGGDRWTQVGYSAREWLEVA